MRITASKRGRTSSKRLDLTELRGALREKRVWCGLGLVWVPDGESAHYELTANECFVHVQLMPNQEPLMCRLACLGGGLGEGVWRIPPVGSEVAVLLQDGDTAADPLLVGVLSTGQVPTELDVDTLVVRAPKVVVVASAGDVTVEASGTVTVGQTGGTAQGVALGNLVNTFDTLVKTHTHAVSGAVASASPQLAAAVVPTASATVKVTP